VTQSKEYPSIRQAIWLLLLAILLLVGLGLIPAIIGILLNSPLAEHPAVLAAVNLAAIGLVLTWGFFKKTKASFGEVFPLKRLHLPLVLPMTLTIVGLAILINLIDSLLLSVLPMPAWIEEAFTQLVGEEINLWGSILALVVVAPLTEELLFRGLILRGFLSRYTVRKAAFASAILFGLLHLNPWQFPAAVILGVLFAWWFVRTRSLLPCLFGHALFNALPIILLAAFRSEIQDVPSSTANVEFLPLWFNLFGLILTALGIWLFMRMSAKANGIPSED